jgi:hypothetical protein
MAIACACSLLRKPDHGADAPEGDVARFHGREYIEVGGVEAYALDYFGGLIKP